MPQTSCLSIERVIGIPIFFGKNRSTKKDTNFYKEISKTKKQLITNENVYISF